LGIQATEESGWDLEKFGNRWHETLTPESAKLKVTE